MHCLQFEQACVKDEADHVVDGLHETCEDSATRLLHSLQSQPKHRNTLSIHCTSTTVLTIFSRPEPATDEAKSWLVLCAMLEENHMRVVVFMHLQKVVFVISLTADFWLCSI